MRRREVPGTARFLTFSCHRQLKLLENPRIKDLFVEHLAATADRLRVDVLAWVIMPEHVHLIAYSEDPVTSMTRFTHAVKRPFALRVLNRWRTLNAVVLTKLAHGDGHRFWETGGGFDRNVVGEELLEKIRYIHANPVRRQIVERPTDYPWSSASAYEGLPYAGPPVRFDLLPASSSKLT
jgi:putative transposase